MSRMTLLALTSMPLLVALYVLTSTVVLNPPQYLQRITGQWALNFLLITLSVTPLRKVLAWPSPARYRRQLGLTCFFYACCHFLTYTVFDRNLDLADMSFDISKRPAILIGLMVLIALVPLAATSSNAAQRYLGGRRWKRLHWIIYPASVLATAHYFLISKVALAQPLGYMALLALLLLLRLKHFRKERS
jgi:methionine sulfoxide reductase heme-binding subunit